MWLKDERRAELSKLSSTPRPKPRKVGLKKCLERGPAPAASVVATDNLPGNNGVPDLSLSTPSLDWEHMVDQLNQDPHADSVTESGQSAVEVEGGNADIAGDEEVEIRDEGPSMRAALGSGPAANDLDWDPRDLLFKFNDDNSGVTHTPAAASTPVALPISDEIPELEDTDPEGPPDVSPPRSPSTNTPPMTLPQAYVPDYSNRPLIGFSWLELHQVVPWIRFEA